MSTELKNRRDGKKNTLRRLFNSVDIGTGPLFVFLPMSTWIPRQISLSLSRDSVADGGRWREWKIKRAKFKWGTTVWGQMCKCKCVYVCVWVWVYAVLCMLDECVSMCTPVSVCIMEVCAVSLCVYWKCVSLYACCVSALCMLEVWVMLPYRPGMVPKMWSGAMSTELKFRRNAFFFPSQRILVSVCAGLWFRLCGFAIPFMRVMRTAPT